MTDRSKRLTAIAVLALPAMLMMAATDPKSEKKGSSAVWIALAAVFISLGAAFTASRSSAKTKRGDGSDTMTASAGSDTGHHKDSHANDHSSGDSGGGGDGGGGGD